MSDVATREKDEASRTGQEWDQRVEKAPSIEAPDEPELPRTIGMIGASFIIFGGLALFFNAIGWTEKVGTGMGTVIVLLGAIGLLTHSAFDPELQVRRLYWGAGVVLLGGGALLCFVRIFSTESALFYVGYPAMLGGLLFFLSMIRHEEDDDWRELTMKIIGGSGLAMGLLAVLVGQDLGGVQFLVPYGLLFGLLGLANLTAYLSHQETENDWKRYAVLAILGIGAFAFIVGLLRSVVPPLLYWMGAWREPPAFYLVPNGIVLMTLGLVYLAVFGVRRSDNQVVVLIRRELGAFFYSPIAYVLLAGITVIGGLNYVSFVGTLMRREVLEPILESFFISYLFIFAVTAMVPVLTMRMLSEEKRSGTLELLMTTPIQERTVIFSKFMAGLLLFLLTWIPVLLYLVALRVGTGQAFEYRTIFAFLLALVITGAHFISMGLFFSGLTGNQIASAVLTFVGMLALLTVTFVRTYGLSPTGGVWAGVWEHADYVSLWNRSFQGTFVPRHLIFHASMATIWLFASVKVLESRRWR